MFLRCSQDFYKQLRQPSGRDILVGFAILAILPIPVFLYHNVSPSALLFGYFNLLIVTGVPIVFALRMAAVAARYGMVVGLFIHRDLTLKKLWDATNESAATSSIIIVLMAMAPIFGNIMTIEQVPEYIAQQVLAFTQNKIIVLLMINVLLLFIGVFMEALAAIVIVTPVLLPLALKMGVDSIHFEIIMVMNLVIGFVTPPVGVNLFVASSISKIGIENIARAAVPFLLIMLAILMLVTFVPIISLALI